MAKRSLSQNFLIDSKIAKQIVRDAHPCPGDRVLEIGPGKGALTQMLLDQKLTVFAIEKDDDLAMEWEKKNNPYLHFFHADALTFPYDSIPSDCKVIANLPYHITTPLLRMLFALPFPSLTLMMQKEVGDKLQAPVKTRLRSPVTVWREAYGSIRSSFSVPASAFLPKPNVDSAVLTLIGREKRASPSFFSFVEKGFQQRRKMLKGQFGEAVLKEAGIPLTARPEELSLTEWETLFGSSS